MFSLIRMSVNDLQAGSTPSSSPAPTPTPSPDGMILTSEQEACCRAILTAPPGKQATVQQALGIADELVAVFRAIFDGQARLIVPYERDAVAWREGFMYGTAEETWSYLCGRKQDIDDDWNLAALHHRIVTCRLAGDAPLSDVPKPNPAFAQFWGFDINRARLPIVRPALDDVAMPKASSKLRRLKSELDVVAWLYPGCDEKRIYRTIREHAKELHTIIIELAKGPRMRAVLASTPQYDSYRQAMEIRAIGKQRAKVARQVQLKALQRRHDQAVLTNEMMETSKLLARQTDSLRSVKAGKTSSKEDVQAAAHSRKNLHSPPSIGEEEDGSSSDTRVDARSSPIESAGFFCPAAELASTTKRCRK